VFNILCLVLGGGEWGRGFHCSFKAEKHQQPHVPLVAGVGFFLQIGDLSKCFQWKDPLLTMLCLQALLHGTTCGATCQVILSGYGHWQ
jgi:hypothetical protein